MPKSRIFLLMLVTLTLTSGCTSFERSSDRGRSRTVSPKKESPFDDSKTEETVVEGEEESLQDAPVRPEEVTVPRVGVILGPGMALSLSHAGVLKAFDESKIPIEQVVGLEWGAVVGALYSKQGMANDAQWRIYKLKKEDLPGKSFFSSSIKADSVKSMNGFLTDGLQKDQISASKIPFACPTMSLRNGRTYWQRQGRMVDVVSRCISFPPLFEPVSASIVGNPFAVSAAVRHLKQRGINLIIFIDVLHKGELLSKENITDNYESFILWNEIRRLTGSSYGSMGEVIVVNTGPFKLTDFDKKQALVQRGEAAGRAAVKKIVKKYGF